MRVKVSSKRQKSGIHRSKSSEHIERRSENYFRIYSILTHTHTHYIWLIVWLQTHFFPISRQRNSFVFPSLEKRFRKKIQFEMTLSIIHTRTYASARPQSCETIAKSTKWEILKDAQDLRIHTKWNWKQQNQNEYNSWNYNGNTCGTMRRKSCACNLCNLKIVRVCGKIKNHTAFTAKDWIREEEREWEEIKHVSDRITLKYVRLSIFLRIVYVWLNVLCVHV